MGWWRHHENLRNYTNWQTSNDSAGPLAQTAGDSSVLGIRLPESGYHVTFVIPMPKSWSKKKRAQHVGQPHQQKPDKDNLEKALLDAVFDEDSHVWDGRVTKIWGETGQIIIEEAR